MKTVQNNAQTKQASVIQAIVNLTRINHNTKIIKMTKNILSYLMSNYKQSKQKCIRNTILILKNSIK